MTARHNTSGRNRRRGKKTEAHIANMMGGARMGILGKDDIRTDEFSIEVKDRQKCVVTGWMEQAEKNCGTMTPMVVLHITNARHDTDIVMMRIGDFMKLRGITPSNPEAMAGISEGA